MKMPTKQIFSLIFKGMCLLLSGIGVGWLIGLSVSPVIHIVITSLIAFVVSITGALAGLNVSPDKESSPESFSLKQKLQFEINPVPVMLIVIGIAFGASLGVYGRTNNWLGTNVNGFVAEWEKTKLGEQEISRRLFETLYPAKIESAPINVSQNSESTNANSSDGNGFEGNSTEKKSKTESVKPEQRKNEKKDSSQKTESKESTTLSQKTLTAGLFTASADECDVFNNDRDEKLRDRLTNYRNKKIETEAEKCPDTACLRAIVNKICPK